MVLGLGATGVGQGDEDVVRVPLVYREVPWDVGTATIPFRSGSVVASQSERIPEGFSSEGTLWGTMPLGDPAVAIVWDRDKVRLGVDRDGDGRVEGDGDLVSGGSRRFGYQVFTNVTLALTNGPVVWRVALEVDLHDWRQDVLAGQVRARSFYEGQVEFAGATWQVGWIPVAATGGGGTARPGFLLRPWGDRDAAFTEPQWTQVLAADGQVFVQDRAYQIELGRAMGGADDSLELAMRSEPVRTGSLRLDGMYIERLSLAPQAGGLATVLVTNPGSVTAVPAGEYRGLNVWLRGGDREAWGRVEEQVRVSEGGETRVVVGGPLTNSVDVTVLGAALRMDYRLIGAGGRRYELVGEDRSQPPRFAIYRGERKVGAGNFEYG
jgi:hypothetical protein